ncbi:MAG: DNA polymerase III subunit delta' [Candidatus Omnitrophica bacterium]|nr:DNA polymerase III subunit delta' [Candidatus Omnitrophota bacterium]
MSFKDVVGLDPVIRMLKGQIAGGRVGQTYLFTGPAGIGKRLLAVKFAKVLMCTEPDADGACNGCETCLKINEKKFPDLLEVHPESESGSFGIEQVRLLANWISLTPYRGPWKAAIVDEADRMTEEASHAFLKLLEEPTGRTLIILVTTTPGRLPATLLSRCHVVRCAPQGIRRTERFLTEKARLEPEVASLLASVSGGRLGIALSYHQENRLPEKNRVLDQLLAAWRNRELEIPLGTFPRRQVEEALDWLAGWWRDLAVLSLGGKEEWVIHQDRLKDLKAGTKETVADLLEWAEKALAVQDGIQKNASAKIALAGLLSASKGSSGE